MSIDLSQFQQVFFEESFEGVETMEAQLLELDADDNEALHAVFRAAHSIKGGAGMFDFAAIVEFTHLVETLLDEMRSGKRAVNTDLTTLLLQASDCINTLLQLAQQNKDSIPEQIETVQQQLQEILAGDDTTLIDNSGVAEACAAIPTVAADSPTETTSNIGWRILFHPHRDMLKTGNPLRN